MNDQHAEILIMSSDGKVSLAVGRCVLATAAYIHSLTVDVERR